MNFLFLVMLFPLLGFVLLISFQKLFSKYMISTIGVGSICLSVLCATWVSFDFLNHVSANESESSFFFVQSVYTWISLIDFCIPVVFRLDGLSLSMLLLVTWVSFLIHIYSLSYMSDHPSYFRFLAYMNLFVANMIILILADNLLLMYFGWEGVGLCSYLLIGFYYVDKKHGESALKSFLVTRIGDIFLLCAIFMFYACFHTLDVYKLMSCVSTEFFSISPNLIALFLVIAAVAKSAQFPFQIWLSDAMVAPAPVSALIHAATMVTAGVYLIARTHNVFVIAPNILYVIGVIGSITLIISSCSALVQTDIKKILAYSTVGQISYMFIALSVQAWESSIFHLMVHAFFKALLFLASGSLIMICHGEQNIFKIGKLYTSTPLIYFSFLVGGASLSAIPIVTSGFYSKGEVLWNVFLSNNSLFIIAGLIGSFLTSLYTFRMIFIIFYSGSNVVKSKSCYDIFQGLSLLILLVLSTCFGALLRLPMFGALPSSMQILNNGVCVYNKFVFEICLGVIVISGCFLSGLYYLCSYRFMLLDKLLNCLLGRVFVEFVFVGWGCDWIYKHIVIKPYLLIARVFSFDPVHYVLYFSVRNIVNFFSDRLVLSENGQIRHYIMSVIFGITVLLLILMFL
ncbi:NADH-quinone oxidoreductase subunit L [Blochmannia endosymbiont of Polyrhachis (Hedomyrma) turneri]|uniref:NADH-quinone oxidoreductase subunit L n=1 Tax=Blochmannia endosymbiont of Polyrhachis (Hedomyrma) turneri TaxID=1505596 RepID=UPI00061A6EDB|nr:NADH-quinone oxidoreductase subunit L [Blochmannia endosymbiont of Polyrhachis (Hedomyrma) turneri]AKC60045.1 NADH-quinone oxidoreductase subunit L [Blochmannia endosymbiont of Polyrhachis (Hedomyrma) turneri]